MKIDDEYTPLLIQDDGKPCWENAVKILYRIGYPHNRFSIPRLIWLMQDMHWPGVPLAIEIMKSIDKGVIAPLLENTIIEACEEEDFMWLGGLKRLAEILNIHESDFTNKKNYELLDLSDW